jgi:hypothetical protein
VTEWQSQRLNDDHDLSQFDCGNAVVSADRGGGRLIVVDAIDGQAAAFYRRYDFKQVKDNPRRLVLKVSTARAAIGLESFQVVSEGQVALSSATLTRADGSQVHMFVDSNDLRRVADRLRELSDQAGPVDITQVILEVLG